MNDRGDSAVRAHEQLIFDNIERVERALADVAGASWIIRFIDPSAKDRMPLYLGGTNDHNAVIETSPEDARQFLSEAGAWATARNARHSAGWDAEAVLYETALAEAIDHHRRSLAEFRDFVQEMTK